MGLPLEHLQRDRGSEGQGTHWQVEQSSGPKRSGNGLEPGCVSGETRRQ